MTSRHRVVPARLRKFRKEGLRLQVQELAARVGVTPSAVSAWEAGKSCMSGSAEIAFEGVFVAAGFAAAPTWAWLAGDLATIRATPPIIVHT